jgi:hypothetical protein
VICSGRHVSLTRAGTRRARSLGWPTRDRSSSTSRALAVICSGQPVSLTRAGAWFAGPLGRLDGSGSLLGPSSRQGKGTESCVLSARWP